MPAANKLEQRRCQQQVMRTAKTKAAPIAKAILHQKRPDGINHQAFHFGISWVRSVFAPVSR